MLTLTIPTNACSLMWNGYTTPYSSTGTDWMDGAVWVMDMGLLEETRITTLINLWIDYRNAQRPLWKDDNPSVRYLSYCKRMQYQYAQRLESQYGIILQ